MCDQRRHYGGAGGADRTGCHQPTVCDHCEDSHGECETADKYRGRTTILRWGGGGL